MVAPVSNRDILRQALDLRRSQGLAASDAVEILDFVTNLGLQIRFCDIPSADGLYLSTRKPTIVLGAHRPIGRQRFTCAHELGHHVLGHGTHVDEKLQLASDSTRSHQEFAADLFAGFLLMPRPAVVTRFKAHGTLPDKASPRQVLHISRELNVSYTALIVHSKASLSLLSDDHAKHLSHHSPGEIERKLSPIGSLPGRLITVTPSWPNVPVDIEVDDHLLLSPSLCTEGDVTLMVEGRPDFKLAVATQPGIGRILGSKPDSWARHLRVRQKGYVGLARFRHLHDPTFNGQNSRL